MFPMPAMLRWSSSASPKPRVWSSWRRRTRKPRSSSSGASTSGPSAASRRSKRVRDSVISSSTGPSNSTTSCWSVRITSQARRGERRQRCPRRYTPHWPVMRRCECRVRSPSKRMNRCLPRASTARTGRPSRRSGQRSIAWRGCGVSIETIGFPTRASPTRRAAEWMVSPSGTLARLRDDRERLVECGIDRAFRAAKRVGAPVASTSAAAAVRPRAYAGRRRAPRAAASAA